MVNGWYYYNRSNPPQGTLPTEQASYASLIRVTAAGNTCIQEAFDTTDSDLHGTVLRRTIYRLGSNAKIYPWCWINPSMMNGIAYRTDERYQGNFIYRKLENNISYWSIDGITWTPEELFRDYYITVKEEESIQSVIDSLPRFGNGYNAIITINGTHTEDIELKGFTGFVNIWLRMDPGAIINGSISVDSCRYVQISTYGDSSNTCTINSGTQRALLCYGASNVYISRVNITTTNAVAILAQYQSRVAVQACTIEATGTGNYEAAIESSSTGCEIRASQTTISANTTCGLTAHYSSYILFNGTNNAKTKQTTYAGGKIETL